MTYNLPALYQEFVMKDLIAVRTYFLGVEVQPTDEFLNQTSMFFKPPTSPVPDQASGRWIHVLVWCWLNVARCRGTGTMRECDAGGNAVEERVWITCIRIEESNRARNLKLLVHCGHMNWRLKKWKNHEYALVSWNLISSLICVYRSTASIFMINITCRNAVTVFSFLGIWWWST